MPSILHSRSPDVRQKPEVSASILVATCGNVMAADDALGPLVADRVRRMRLPGVEVASLDMRPAGLIDLLLVPHRALLIVDAVLIPDQLPGVVVDLDWRSPDRPPLSHDDVLSTHGLSIANQIELADRLFLLPVTIRLLGMVIKKASVGQPVSELLAEGATRIADRIRRFAVQPKGKARHA